MERLGDHLPLIWNGKCLSCGADLEGGQTLGGMRLAIEHHVPRCCNRWYHRFWRAVRLTRRDWPVGVAVLAVFAYEVPMLFATGGAWWVAPSTFPVGLAGGYAAARLRRWLDANRAR